MYIVFAILIFSVLIFVHELGHFIAAKASGVRVNEFSLCMGPAIWQKTKGETTYSLRCIPIGGFCAMEGEDEKSDDPRAFTSAPVWRRLIILVAGSAMNFLAGLLILAILYATVAGISVPKIGGFFDGCPLESETGLQVGDELYRIDGERVYIYSDVSMLLARNTSGVFDLEVIRNGEKVRLDDFSMTPQNYEVDGEKQLKYGMLFTSEQTTPAGVLRSTWRTACDFCRLVRLGLQDLIHGIVGIDEMSGPVGIVSIIAETGKNSDTVADAALNIFYFAAFLAVNLAVMNMLPIPALDGGRVFLLLVTFVLEKIFRRKINPKYEAYIHAGGMILLLGFIAFITLKDIIKLFG